MLRTRGTSTWCIFHLDKEWKTNVCCPFYVCVVSSSSTGDLHLFLYFFLLYFFLFIEKRKIKYFSVKMHLIIVRRSFFSFCVYHLNIRSSVYEFYMKFCSIIKSCLILYFWKKKYEWRTVLLTCQCTLITFE